MSWRKGSGYLKEISRTRTFCAKSTTQRRNQYSSFL
ncbi:unnamed protein product [Tenebrio molitor]|nr:unnamed protein product [Tenebrio molitor]